MSTMPVRVFFFHWIVSALAHLSRSLRRGAGVGAGGGEMFGEGNYMDRQAVPSFVYLQFQTALF